MPTTAANAEVLEFYRVMPFNYMDSASAQAAVIRQHNNLRPHYPILEPRLKPGVRFSMSAAAPAGSRIRSHGITGPT